jgi:hypothetical protein
MLGGILLAWVGLATSGGDCFATVRDVEAGAIIAAADVVPVVCDAGRARASLRFEPGSGATIAAAALPDGTYLGRILPSSGRLIAKGATLTIRSTSGAVTIEREVIAMQTGRDGKRMFVRDERGQVFAVPLLLEKAQ